MRGSSGYTAYSAGCPIGWNPHKTKSSWIGYIIIWKSLSELHSQPVLVIHLKLFPWYPGHPRNTTRDGTQIRHQTKCQTGFAHPEHYPRSQYRFQRICGSLPELLATHFLLRQKIPRRKAPATEASAGHLNLWMEECMYHWWPIVGYIISFMIFLSDYNISSDMDQNNSTYNGSIKILAPHQTLGNSMRSSSLRPASETPQICWRVSGTIAC